MRSRLWSLLLVPLLLGAGQPIDPHNLAWDSSGGPDLVAGYEVVQGWDGAEIGSTTTSLSVPLAARNGTAYAARVRALPTDPVAIQPSEWATLTAEWPDAVPQIVSLSELGRTTAPLPGGGPVMADPAFGGLGSISSTGISSVNSQSATITNVAAGDLVLAFVQRDVQTQCTGVTMAGNAMELAKRNNSASNNFAIDVWAIIAPSAVSSATIAVSYSGFAQWATLFSARWSGIASATPVTSSCNSTGCSGLATGSTNRLAQSITTSVRSLIIAAGTDWDDYRTHTPATGWTERADGSGSPVTSIQFIFDRVADAGTFGGATAFSTTSASDQYLSVLLAFEASDQGGAAATALPRRALDGPFYGALRGSVR